MNSTALNESSPADMRGSLAPTSLPSMAATASWTWARMATSDTPAPGAFSGLEATFFEALRLFLADFPAFLKWA